MKTRIKYSFQTDFMTIPPMPNCTADHLEFGRLGRRVIEASFAGGDLSSDGGVMLLRQVDERLGLTSAVAAVLHDPRDPDRITHSMEDLGAQRIYALCTGYEGCLVPQLSG